MAYRRGAWRVIHDRNTIQLNINVEADLKARLAALADRMRGCWDYGVLVGRLVELAELAAAGTPVPWEEIFYPSDPTERDKQVEAWEKGITGKPKWLIEEETRRGVRP